MEDQSAPLYSGFYTLGNYGTGKAKSRKKPEANPDKPVSPFTKGTLVRIMSVSHSKPLGVNDFMLSMARVKAIGKIATDPKNADYSNVAILISSEHHGNYAFDNKDLEILPPEQQNDEFFASENEAIRIRLNSQWIEYHKEFMERMNKLHATDSIPFDEINFLKYNPKIDPNNNFAQHILTLSEEKCIAYKMFEGEKINDVLFKEKEGKEFLVFVPVSWAKACGFKEEKDVLDWIKFISEIDLECSVEYISVQQRPGHRELPSVSDLKQVIRTSGDNVENIAKFYAGSHPTGNEYYTFKFLASECGPINLMFFKMITMFCKSRTYRAAGLCLQMRKVLDASVSNWEIFLMSLIFDTGYLAGYGNKLNCGKTVGLIKPFASQNALEQVKERMMENPMFFSDSVMLTQIDPTDQKELYEFVKEKNFQSFYLKYKTL